MKKLGMMYKVVIIFLVVSAIATFTFIHLLKKVYKDDLVAQARSTAQQVLIFRKWSAGFGGVWTKDKFEKQVGYLMVLKAMNAESRAYPLNGKSEGEKLEDLGVTRFYLHNPALATRELSLLSKKESGWSFTVVSDRYMAPQDKPDGWETKAIKMIKNSKLKGGEYWSWDSNKFRYAKVIYVRKSCLVCHGTKDQVKPVFMKALKAKYGKNAVKAMNYKPGDLRGIISVVITPHDLVSKVVSFIDVWIILAIVLTFLVFVLFAINVIIKPIKKLTDAAEAISLGDMEVDLGVGGLKEKDVKDEITRLAIAFNRMRSSVKSALRRLRERAKGTLK